MLASAVYRDLLKYRAVLEAALEANPAYREIQALDILIECHKRERGSPASNPTLENVIDLLPQLPRQPKLKTSKEDRDRIAGAAKAYQLANGNKPKTIRELAAAIQNQGVLVPGKNAGTTLGAILSRRPEFELCDKENRSWRLTEKDDATASVHHSRQTCFDLDRSSDFPKCAFLHVQSAE